MKNHYSFHLTKLIVHQRLLPAAVLAVRTRNVKTQRSRSRRASFVMALGLILNDSRPGSGVTGEHLPSPYDEELQTDCFVKGMRDSQDHCKHQ